MVKHLACIMDGNRRWAKARGLPPWEGHRQGSKTIEHVVDFCLEKNISYLSLYAFSLENLNRTSLELNFLFSLIAQEAETVLNWALKKGVRITFVGDSARFPSSVVPHFASLEAKTAAETKLHVQILFCYGGRQEICRSVKEIARKVKSGELDPEAISDTTVAEHLWTCAVPEPDLVVRTGGAQRMSNFLLYQAAYAELYFSEQFWPAITHDDLDKAVDYFYECKRNFGK
ncbi:di-trans,poly-cis-decaprenylcistransferase [Candidatus Dependentiae bacterium HGW-Dependentiae-1]|nr:MAG: di-trans,poly-cis-decaprenylcistransferase [Candidatus Dependentiae bacterium HGW-Dependentiae-1]